MVMSKRWEVFFTSRVSLVAAALAKARKTLGSALIRDPSKSEVLPLWTKLEQSKADGTMQKSGPDQPKPDVAHFESNPDRQQALGASALLSAWKERDAVLSSRPQSLKAGAPPTQSEPHQTQAFGASALLGAWKERDLASSPLPEPPKPEVRPFQAIPDPPETTAASGKSVPPAPGQLAMLASVFLFVAAAAVVGGWILLSTDSLPLFKDAKTDVAQPNPVELAGGPLAACPAQPIVTVAGEKDGRFPMQADESGLIAADIASFLVLGQSASAAGRVRDAEVALLMSCRIADKIKGSASVESADAKYRLGLHYAELALHGGSAGAANRPELLARAESLYADSLLTYAARFGDVHEKSRLAAEGLASVRQTLAQKPQPTTPASIPVTNTEISSRPGKSSRPARPGSVVMPKLDTLPAADGEATIRQAPPGIKDCPPAVATLGLCNPAS